MLPVGPVLHPKIFFRNTTATPVARVTVNHVLDLGITDDPLLTGTFTTNIVTEDVDPGSLLWHEFGAVALAADDIVRHTIGVENLHATDDLIVQMWVEGFFEETLKVLPTFEPIVI
jgi:hypothetical protein